MCVCVCVCVSWDLLQGYPIGRFYWNQESSTESSFLALKITTQKWRIETPQHWYSPEYEHNHLTNNRNSRWFKSWPNFIPKRWRSLNPLKGSRFHHPKKVTTWITRLEDFCNFPFESSFGGSTFGHLSPGLPHGLNMGGKGGPEKIHVT